MTQSRLVLSVAAVSNSTGGATFTLQTTEQGYVYEGSVQIPNAPSGALFVAKVLGTFWGQWAGPTNFGPVQTWGGEYLQVVATGLTPNTSFTMTFTGVEKDEESAVPIPPAAPMSVVSVETATLLVNGKSCPVGTTLITITPPSLTRRLTLAVNASNFDLQFISVTGNTSGIVYFAEDDSTSSLPEVQFTAIEPTIDASYTVEVINSGSSGNPIILYIVASTTNPLIIGEQNSPIPVTPKTSSGFVVWEYEPVSGYGHTSLVSGAAQTIATSSGTNAIIMGTVSVSVPAGRDLIQLKDSSGTVFWEAYVTSDATQSFVINAVVQGLNVQVVGMVTGTLFSWTYGVVKNLNG